MAMPSSLAPPPFGPLAPRGSECQRSEC